MSFNGYRDKAFQDRKTIERLAEGKKPRDIADEFGVSYSTLRRRLARHVQAIGCATVEQAVASHVAQKIKNWIPPALHQRVDMALQEIPNTSEIKKK